MYSVVHLNLTAMKQIFYTLFFLSISSCIMAQGSWKVYCGKKLMLKASVPDETLNRIRLSEKELSSDSDLRIVYHEQQHQKNWNRFFTINNGDGEELKAFEKLDTLKIALNDIKHLLEDNGKLKIYTWSLPEDPELAARVRVRRVYLCSLAKQ
jgi:hypothetical protein